MPSDTAFRKGWAIALFAFLSAGSIAIMAQGGDQRLRDANLARQAGKADEALKIVETVLAGNPAHTDATRLKIEILLAQAKRDAALNAYDRYVVARKQSDPVLLGVIATSELRQLATLPDQGIRIPALERLARSGDAPSRQALRSGLTASAAASVQSLGLLVSLTRLGDKEAEGSLGRLLDSAAPSERFEVFEGIGEAGARSLASKVAGYLSDADPATRINAVKTLGVLLVPSTVPQLQSVFDSDLPSVKMFAAVALKRLGQTSADAFVAKLLESEVTETRLLAGQAYQMSKSTQWVAKIRELRIDRNERYRVQVAELLACCEVATADALLREALRSQNPLLRRDAARVLESKALADAPLARQLVGDADPVVRLLGAGAALRLTQAPASGR